MNILGDIAPKFDGDSSEIINSEYAFGKIVQLTEKESKALSLLQTAWNGDLDRGYRDHFHPESDDMSSQFKAVLCFVHAKFAVNEFKNSISMLDKLLIEAEGIDEL